MDSTDLESISIESGNRVLGVGDPIRLQILGELAGGQQCVCELLEEIGIAANLLSYRFGVLRDRVHVEIAGEFGEKRFLVQLEELVIDRPFDLVDLVLRVPTIQGARESTPSFMAFDVVSTEQADVSEFAAEVRSLARRNDLVWVA